MQALDQSWTISRRLQWRVAGVFFLLVLATRIPGFFVSVLDWDESLYVLMAQQWWAGHLPYTTIWDNKPIGIYGIFLIFEAIFGNPVIAIRVATVVAVSATAFAVFRIALLLPQASGRGSLAGAVFAGIAFIVGSLSNDGLAANTEIFMACFTAFAVVCALSPQFCAARPEWRGLAAGVLFGMAFMTKYVAVFEAPALGFALLFLTPGTKPARLIACGAAALGAALPLLLTILLYAASGKLGLWWDCSIASNFLRVATPISGAALTYVLSLQLARWLPLFAAAALLTGLAPPLLARILRTGVVSRPGLFHLFLLLWLAGGSLGVAAAKLFYDHYFLQILPVLCVCLDWALLRSNGRMALPERRLVFASLLAIPSFGAGASLMNASRPLFTAQDGRHALHADTPAQIAGAIAALPAGLPRRIYVFDYQPIIYALAGQSPPTRYAFPSVLTKCFLAHVAGVDAAAEEYRILAGNPDFIVRSLFPLSGPGVNQAVYDEVEQDLEARYALWHRYSDAAVYRLRDGARALGRRPGTPLARCG